MALLRNLSPAGVGRSAEDKMKEVGGGRSKQDRIKPFPIPPPPPPPSGQPRIQAEADSSLV